MELFKYSMTVFFLKTIELHFVLSQGENAMVTTRYGLIRGAIRRFPDINRQITAVRKFLGIPYARPPTGERRFKPPQPLSSWKPDIYDGTYFRSICVQDYEYINFFWPNISHPQSEDCLYLNIYTPFQNFHSEKENYPVMVYIHGGGYEAGSPIVSPGDVVPLWGIVLVTIQYRLGPFGFFTSSDSEAPGNYGMLDQVEALKWVKENVLDFGGDPSNVTIFGESAGGSSVGLLLLSPLTKGLFHRAISISGIDLSPFAIGSSKEVARVSRRIAKDAGCPTEGSRQMINCLRRVDASNIAVTDINVWRPVVDHDFLPDAPINLRKAGKFHQLPYMSGFTSREGSYFFPHVLEDVTPENFHEYTRSIFYKIGSKYGQTLEGGVPRSIVNMIAFLYTPWPDKNDLMKVKSSMADEVGDFAMTAPTHLGLTHHSQKAPVYMYEFAHQSNLYSGPPWRGVAHKDDTPYEFGFPLMNLTILQKYDDVDSNISKLIITLFANFAKYGNPTPTPLLGVSWDEFNSSNMVYFRIQSQPEMATNFRPTKIAFWNEYYEKMFKEEDVCSCKSTSMAFVEIGKYCYFNMFLYCFTYFLTFN